MILETVELKNYRTHALTSVRFAERMTGILGPNEVGKSAILEAVAWALYGAKAVRSTMERVRWRGASERDKASVDVVFRIGERRYHVERSEADAALYEWQVDETDTFKAGTWLKIAATRSAVEKKAAEVVGMSLDEFWAVRLASQKDLDRLEKMKPTERQSFFLEVLGIGAIDDAIEACRKDKNAAAREAAEAAAGLGPRDVYAKAATDYAAELGALEAETVRLRALWPGATRERDRAVGARNTSSEVQREHERLSKLLAEAEYQARDADRAVARIGQEREAAEIAQSSIASQDVAADLALAVDQADFYVEAAQRARRIAQSLYALQAAREHIDAVESYERDLQQSIDAYDSAAHDVALSEYRAAAEAHQAARDAARDAVLLAGTRRDAALDESVATHARMTALRQSGPDAPCGTCGRPLGEVYESVLADLGARMVELTRICDEATAEATRRVDLGEHVEAVTVTGARVRNHDSLRANAEEARREMAKTRSRRQNAAARVADALHEAASLLGADVEEDDTTERWNAVADESWERANNWKQLRDELQAKASSYARLRTLADRLPALQRQEAEAREQMEKAQDDFGRIDEEIHALGFDAAILAVANAEAQVAMEAWRTLQSDVDRADDAVRTTTAREEAARAELAAYDERAATVAALRHQARTLEETEKRLLAFRAQEVESIRPDLEAIASGIIALLTDGRHEGVRVTDDYAIVLLEGGAEEHDASGGASDLRSVALRIALAELVASRAGTAVSGLWLDEPFGFLDETRRQNFMGLLRRLLPVFGQVIVISHMPDTKDGVDAAIVLQFDAARGCAYAEQPAAVA